MHGLQKYVSQVSIIYFIWKCVSLVDHGILLAFHLDGHVSHWIEMDGRYFIIFSASM
jgi:hypothetical protein